MPVTLQARLPADDIAQRLLFAPDGPGRALFPGGHFRSPAHVERRLAFLDGGPRKIAPAERAALLAAENAFAPLSPEQAANLADADSERALFLVTGQQPGLAGGPVLWYYKALTCAGLARQWSSRLSRPVIPLFWAAGDDSDLMECNSLELLEDPRPENGAAGNSLPFPDAARPLAMSERKPEAAALEPLLARLADEWGPEAAAELRRCYLPGRSLTEGFLRLAQGRLAREGVLFLDGYSPRLRALSGPLLRDWARRWEDLEKGLDAGTAALREAGLRPPVPLRPGLVHAFELRSGERHRLFAFRNAGGEHSLYTADQPGRNHLPALPGLELTHDVFTRPLVADAVFPVLGHVLGPAELRYFAQLAPVFRAETGDMPLMHPRMSATVLSRAALEEFRKQGWEYGALARLRPSLMRARLAEHAWRAHPAFAELPVEPVGSWMEGIREAHARYFHDAGPLDGLEAGLARAWRKYLRSLERMAYADGPETARLVAHLRWLGNGMGQDRHLLFHSLLKALGEDGLAALREQADPAGGDGQLFTFD